MEPKVKLPLLPLRDIVVFPNMVIPLFVGRDKSISALNVVMKKDKKIVLVTQKNSEIDDPKKTDVFMYGCEGNILQLLKLPDGTVKVLVEGIKRVKIIDFKENEKFITCDYSILNDVVSDNEDLYPLAATAVRRLEKLTSINKKISHETVNTIKQLKAIQKELGEIEDGKDENTSLNKAILKAKMPKEVEKKCLQELKKLKNIQVNQNSIHEIGRAHV